LLSAEKLFFRKNLQERSFWLEDYLFHRLFPVFLSSPMFASGLIYEAVHPVLDYRLATMSLFHGSDGKCFKPSKK